MIPTHAETFVKLGNKDPTKNNFNPEQNNDPYFLISDGNDVEVDDHRKGVV